MPLTWLRYYHVLIRQRSHYSLSEHIADTSLKLKFEANIFRAPHPTRHIRSGSRFSLITKMEKGEATSGSIDIAASDASVSQALFIDPKREAKLVRKLDLYIAPVMTIIFLTAYLDRANIGNAASAGMTEDIGMASSELGSKSSRESLLICIDEYQMP